MNKHDNLRIGIINKHNAIIYYNDGSIIELHSDNDVRCLVEIVCSPIDNDCTWIECIHGVEDTQSIKIGED